jgi:hypothetical protein
MESDGVGRGFHSGRSGMSREQISDTYQELLTLPALLV